MLKWQDDPPRSAERPRPPATGHPDGDASRLWWERIKVERTSALDWQRRAMLAEARVRELEALLEQQAALGGVRVRRVERDVLAVTQQRDWLVALLSLALALGGLAVAVWIGGGRLIGGAL